MRTKLLVDITIFPLVEPCQIVAIYVGDITRHFQPRTKISQVLLMVHLVLSSAYVMKLTNSSIIGYSFISEYLFHDMTEKNAAVIMVCFIFTVIIIIIIVYIISGGEVTLAQLNIQILQVSPADFLSTVPPKQSCEC